MSFWETTLVSLTFFSLMMAIISFWVKRTFWLWGSFVLIALLLGYQSRVINGVALVPIAALGFCVWLIYHKVTSSARAVLMLIVAIISTGLAMHLFPGFHNWKFASDLILSEDAAPYTFWINFDKPFMGIFLLAWAIPLAQSKVEMRQMLLKKGLPLSILGVVLLAGLSFYLGLIRWDPKFTLLIFIWPFVNLFFVTIPEEAFFRGFIQQELYQRLIPRTKLANVFAIFLTALFFMLAHLWWVTSLSYLTAVFIAGCVYGAIYQITKAIEASILCHFLVNLVHFIFFTYPMLK